MDASQLYTVPFQHHPPAALVTITYTDTLSNIVQRSISSFTNNFFVQSLHLAVLFCDEILDKDLDQRL